MPTITGSGVGGGGGLVSKRATSSVRVKGIGAVVAVVVIEMFVPYWVTAGEMVVLSTMSTPLPLVIAAAVPLIVAPPTTKGFEAPAPWVIVIAPPPPGLP